MMRTIFISLISFFLISSLSLESIAAKKGGEETGEKGEAEEKNDDKPEESEKKEVEPIIQSYLNLGICIVPIIKRDKVEAYVRLSIQIATKDSSTIDPYRCYRKRLKDAHFTELYQVLCDQWLPGREPSRDTLQKRLSRVTDKIVGSNVLLTYVTTFYFYKPDKK